MEESGERGRQQELSEQTRHKARLPRFLVKEPVGLGQVVKRIIRAAGVKPCRLGGTIYDFRFRRPYANCPARAVALRVTARSRLRARPWRTIYACLCVAAL